MSGGIGLGKLGAIALAIQPEFVIAYGLAEQFQVFDGLAGASDRVINCSAPSSATQALVKVSAAAMVAASPSGVFVSVSVCNIQLTASVHCSPPEAAIPR